MNAFYERYKGSIKFRYGCFDRLIHARMSRGLLSCPILFKIWSPLLQKP